MSQQIINIGTSPNDGTGDQLRTSFDKCNQNFNELYTSGAGTITEGVWNFNQVSTDTTTAPTSGRFRTNSGNFATATQIAIHRTTINGIDRADTLRTQAAGDIIKCQDQSNADSWCRFILQSAPVDNGTWFQFNVTFNSGGATAPSDNKEIIFTFTANVAGGGGGAPTNAEYLTKSADATLSAERVVTDATAITWDWSTAGQVKAIKAALTGDVTAAADSNATTIANNAVSNAKLADIATARIRGRVSAGTGDPEDLTGTQATTLLDIFTSALKGLVPSSGGGTTNFLRADGTWNVPGGGAGGNVPTYQVFTSGSGTYTTPVGCRQIEVTLVGGGGGGAQGGGTANTDGTAGSATTWGTGPIFSAGGGTSGKSNASGGLGGAGGTVSGSGTPTWSVVGGAGTTESYNSATSIAGVAGGNSTRGGAGNSGNFGADGGNAAVNSGSGGQSGGAGASGWTGGGGGAGATIFAVINTPAATYSYTVGAGGAGAAAANNGGNGGSGVIIVKENY